MARTQWQAARSAIPHTVVPAGVIRLCVGSPRTSMPRMGGNTYRVIAEVPVRHQTYSRARLENPRSAQSDHSSTCKAVLLLMLRRLSRTAAAIAPQEVAHEFRRGIENPPPDLRHPPSRVRSAIVTPDAPPTSPVLHDITEPLKCPIQTPACRRDTCARPRPRDSSAFPVARWRSTGPTVPAPLIEKLGGRVVYALEDLKAWADRGSKTSTSDPGAGTVLPAKRHAAAPLPYAGRARR